MTTTTDSRCKKMPGEDHPGVAHLRHKDDEDIENEKKRCQTLKESIETHYKDREDLQASLYHAINNLLERSRKNKAVRFRRCENQSHYAQPTEQKPTKSLPFKLPSFRLKKERQEQLERDGGDFCYDINNARFALILVQSTVDSRWFTLDALRPIEHCTGIKPAADER
ncbi:MAG: hypothetical protein HQL50_03895 [Magnetococcales bacterium]|nr:hypothetical protein [Magnetococcales bacterium]